MSTSTVDWRGVIIELDDNETKQLLTAINPLAGAGGAAGIGAALIALGIPAYAAGIVAAAIALHITWESKAIEAVNQGNGVILTAPTPALTPGVVIPSTRFPSDINQNWAADRNGTFASPGGDQISYIVEGGVVDPGVVRFRLINQTPSSWDKSFVLRDGQGSQWEIPSTIRGLGQEDLYADQVLNGQQLTFRKPSFFGIWIDVLSVGGLGSLQGGDQATFTWLRD